MGDEGPGDKLPLRTEESTKVDTCSKGKPMAEFLQQSDGSSGTNQVGAKLIIEITNGKNLHEFEVDGKMAIDDGDTGQVDISSIGMKESAKLGIHSGGEPMMESVQQSEGNSCANLVGAETEIRLVEGNNLQDLKVGAETETESVWQSDATWNRFVEGNNLEELKVGAETAIASVQQSDATCCTVKVGAETENRLVEGDSLQELKVGAETEIESVQQSDATCCTVEVGAETKYRIVEGNNLQEFKVGAEMGIESLQQSNATCCTVEVGTETEYRLVEGNNLQELEVGAEMGIESLRQSDEICFTVEVGAEMEIRLVGGKLGECEDGAKMEIIQSAKKSNANCGTNEDGAELDNMITKFKNGQVGENQGSSLQDQFSKLSCEELVPTLGDSQPEMVSSIQSSGMYDETQISLDEQLQTARELNDKWK